MAPLRIVICDSDPAGAENSANICRAICAEQQTLAVLTTFSDGRALLFEMMDPPMVLVSPAAFFLLPKRRPLHKEAALRPAHPISFFSMAIRTASILFSAPSFEYSIWIVVFTVLMER